MGSRDAISERARTRRAAAVAAALLLVALAAALAPGAFAMRSAEPGADSPGALTTTGPTPPPGVSPPAADRVDAVEGQVLLAGVPAYLWRDGCAPTSLGMVLGFYDGHGFPDLIPGDAATQTTAVNQAIASHGSEAAPRHYEDYSLPNEWASPAAAPGTRYPDRSEAPEGDEHESDSLADFMHTSWSADGLSYGWTMTDRIGPALAHYARLRLPGAAASSADVDDEDVYDVLKREIGAGRPLVLYVDSNGDGVTDHAVTGVGFRRAGGYDEYACLDTWFARVRWERFREVSGEYAWGVDGATTFTLTGGETPPAGDRTPPVTSVAGADSRWRSVPETLTFSATDSGSGLDRIETEVDGGGWKQLPDSPPALEVSGQGTHTVRYRAVDRDGNVETPRSLTVRIDLAGPVTEADPARARHDGLAVFRCRVDDATPRAQVRIVVRSRAGVRRANLRLGWLDTGAGLTVSWRCRLPRGRYRYAVLATDEAGNLQSVPASAPLTVR